MSRRASLLAKQNKCKPKVRFPDELVFLDNIKENDLNAVSTMLRRASLKVNINEINDVGEYTSLSMSSVVVVSIFSQVKRQHLTLGHSKHECHESLYMCC